MSSNLYKKSAICENCKLNGGLKKFRFHCKGNVTKFLCYFCIEQLGGPRKALDCLNKNIEFYFEKNKVSEAKQ